MCPAFSPKRLSADALRQAAGTSTSRTTAKSSSSLALILPKLGKLKAPVAAAALAEGVALARYRFDTHLGKSEKAPAELKSVQLIFPRLADAKATRTAAALRP